MSFGSLFKTLARDTKEALGVSRAGDALPAEPLKLRLGGFVEIDTLPYRMLAGRANFELVQCAQPIAARGVVDLNRSWLHRYYFDDDETWLQVKTDGGTDDASVSECILWQYWDAKTPAKHAASELIEASYREGVVILKAGTFDNVIRFLPPLSIDEGLLSEGLDVFEKALTGVNGR